MNDEIQGFPSRAGDSISKAAWDILGTMDKKTYKKEYSKNWYRNLSLGKKKEVLERMKKRDAKRDWKAEKQKRKIQ